MLWGRFYVTMAAADVFSNGIIGHKATAVTVSWSELHLEAVYTENGFVFHCSCFPLVLYVNMH